MVLNLEDLRVIMRLTSKTLTMNKNYLKNNSERAHADKIRMESEDLEHLLKRIEEQISELAKQPSHDTYEYRDYWRYKYEPKKSGRL